MRFSIQTIAGTIFNRPFDRIGNHDNTAVIIFKNEGNHALNCREYIEAYQKVTNMIPQVFVGANVTGVELLPFNSYNYVVKID